MKRPMTPLQSIAFNFIADSIRTGGVAPTRREIASACGIRNDSQVDRIIVSLEDRGLILKVEGKARGITLIEGWERRPDVRFSKSPREIGLSLSALHILATIE